MSPLLLLLSLVPLLLPDRLRLPEELRLTGVVLLALVEFAVLYSYWSLPGVRSI